MHGAIPAIMIQVWRIFFSFMLAIGIVMENLAECDAKNERIWEFSPQASAARPG
jgi:hypothetical protein